MGIFGRFDVRVDPWQIEFGAESPIPAIDEDPEDAERPDLSVEMPEDGWTSVAPKSGAQPELLIFADGVRRIDARLVIRDATSMFHGAFGSFAVGHVVVRNGVATCDEPRATRVVVLGAGHCLPAPVRVSPALSYDPVSTADVEPDGPLRALHNEMRAAEGRLSRELADTPGAVVIVDGPLMFEDPVRGQAIGYIKRVLKLYLPPEKLPVLFSLPAGARTPLFALRSTRRFSRYSWFMRLVERTRIESPLAGIVRLEVVDTVGVDAAKRLADATTIALPRFSSSRSRDPRAPQNLLPVGALETRLRHTLGNPILVRRYVESTIAHEGHHG